MSLLSKIFGGGRSMYLELLEEESRLPKGAKGAFRNVNELGKMLQARANLVKKMDEAKSSGQLTQEQYDNLVRLNRQHSLPQL
ncbi:MAG: hypothetical protein U0R19_40050 [Bryobacteraceae bacterium]